MFAQYHIILRKSTHNGNILQYRTVSHNILQNVTMRDMVDAIYGGDLMFTIKEAAKEFRISERAIRRLVKENKIPVTMVGNRAYISGDWVRAKLERDGSLEGAKV